MPTPPEIRISNTPADLFQAAATEFATLASKAVQSNGKFSVALSGGSTPKSLYALLASGSLPNIPWQKVFFFFGDERDVPPDHPDSNYRMAAESGLFSKVSNQQVLRVRTEEKDANTAALDYEQTLQKFFGLRPGEFPRFDLVLLGLGPDGHTASLFPGTAALNEKSRLVVANWIDKFHTYRITLTLPVLNRAACVMFLASGADKANILREVLENDKADLPSQKVHPADGRLLWLIDRAAASQLG
ncbi:MAG TPA: 6-phosphogluconolactonase [Terriglobales bacterium]|nr:6-phosphogluconolactonase [Terriglobales bacterium]